MFYHVSSSRVINLKTQPTIIEPTQFALYLVEQGTPGSNRSRPEVDDVTSNKRVDNMTHVDTDRSCKGQNSGNSR
ncbi:hypothetical protein J6590_081693 [Homalodisca vitripennis]|nr:hypothetical protein J6590_081693 [Homalodisca vitripennis]